MISSYGNVLSPIGRSPSLASGAVTVILQCSVGAMIRYCSGWCCWNSNSFTVSYAPTSIQPLMLSDGVAPVCSASIRSTCSQARLVGPGHVLLEPGQRRAHPAQHLGARCLPGRLRQCGHVLGLPEVGHADREPAEDPRQLIVADIAAASAASGCRMARATAPRYLQHRDAAAEEQALAPLGCPEWSRSRRPSSSARRRAAPDGRSRRASAGSRLSTSSRAAPTRPFDQSCAAIQSSVSSASSSCRSGSRIRLRTIRCRARSAAIIT